MGVKGSILSMVERLMDETVRGGRGRMRHGAPSRRTRAGRRPGWVLVLGCLLGFAVLAPIVVHGQDDDHDDDHDVASSAHAEDRVAMFSTILVTRDRPAADVACIFCTVRVEGDVRGDVAVMFGTVSVAEGRTISGDVAMLFSSLKAEEGARINGDVATMFSSAQIAPSAHIRGDRAMLGSGLGAAVLIGPILLVVGLVWLMVWGLRRALSY